MIGYCVHMYKHIMYDVTYMIYTTRHYNSLTYETFSGQFVLLH